jgi:hypothetical protein
MTPKQSLTRKQSLIRRSVATLIAAMLVAAWAVGSSIPAIAAPTKGSLDIVSVTDTASGLGAPVQDRPFNVTVRVFDTSGQPTTITQATTVVLEEVSGPGVLGGTTTAVIPRNGSSATISGATYSQFANGVVLRVRAASGVNLESDEVTVEVALKAVGANASPRRSLNLTDSSCATPTAQVPTCGQFLLPNGGSGHVTLSINSCEGLGDCKTAGGLRALVVTGIANLKDANGNPLYSKTSPATLVVACDKDLCRETANGVPKLPLIYTLNNTGQLDKVALPCPAKGVVGEEAACVDYASSSRHQGDLYLHLLFAADMRGSCC